MLHHEEPENVVTLPGQDAALPAAQVRVTAEEFARAVARHQARREEAAKHLEGTVSLGEAVRELNIDITPEELLAEVQAARAAQQQATPIAPRVPRRRRFGVAAASAGLLMAFLSVYCLRISVGHYPITPKTAPAVDLSPPVLSVVPVTASGTILVQDTRGGAPVLRTLQELPDGVPARCSLTQTDGHTTFVDFSSPTASWTLVRHDGQVYSCGWIPNMSAQAIQTSGVTLSARKELVSGAAPQKVSLRLDGLQALPGQGGDEMIVAQKVQTDSHFRDRW